MTAHAHYTAKLFKIKRRKYHAQPQRNRRPVAWLFPAMMDVFVGATALFVAIGIWRGKGLLPWTSAIVFYALSISDHLDAISVVLTSKGPAPAMMSGAPSAVATQLAVMTLLEAAALWALTTKAMRDHFLNS
jgi:hypothetical protein